jgi:predicted nucleotidyltransferase
MSRRIDWGKSLSVLQDMQNVLAAWAFGSARNSEVSPGSDADIGILCDHRPSLDELVELRIDLQDALQFEEIDLVVLNEASPILRFEAIRGVALFCRDANRRAEFASLTAREYEDAMSLLEAGLTWRKVAQPFLAGRL